ncbi:MAG: hypothetical protein PHD97_08595 [Bacteroidales bacterium]|nr:hypothetical protein [Bacteroidales bacterium]
MDNTINIKEKKEEIKLKVEETLNSISEAVLSFNNTDDIASTTKSLKELFNKLQGTVYQLDKDAMILQAIEWLIKHKKPSDKITWILNSQLTKDSSLPDIQARLWRKTSLSAMVSTAEKPVGVVDSRIMSNLGRLGEMKGELYFFVRTDEMKTRAEVKVKKCKLSIAVIKI